MILQINNYVNNFYNIYPEYTELTPEPVETIADFNAAGTPAFQEILDDYIPSNQKTNVEKAKATMDEKNKLLSQFMEWSRVDNDQKRADHLKLTMLKEDHETTHDMFGKTADIARRIMYSEKISIEDMSYLENIAEK